MSEEKAAGAQNPVRLCQSLTKPANVLEGGHRDSGVEVTVAEWHRARVASNHSPAIPHIARLAGWIDPNCFGDVKTVLEAAQKVSRHTGPDFEHTLSREALERNINLLEEAVAGFSMTPAIRKVENPALNRRWHRGESPPCRNSNRWDCAVSFEGCHVCATRPFDNSRSIGWTKTTNGLGSHAESPAVGSAARRF